MAAEPATDPRLTPARADLAAAHLRGRVAAPRYAEGVAMTVVVPVADLLRAPDAPAIESQLLLGDAFTVYDLAGGWAWGQAGHDGYVGHVAAAALGPATDAGRVIIGAPFQHVYPAPDIHTRPMAVLPFLARPAVTGQAVTGKGGAFTALAGGGFVLTAHLAGPEQDFVAVAERFAGTPYLWGGTSAFGLDCSGLVQLAWRATGRMILRDSDMQAGCGRSLAPGESPARGDLVFWKGHVGILQDAARLLHANGHHMRVVSEPLAEAAARIAAAGGGPVAAIRRPY
jgi:cell wall-associated NlpC family hydrolase